MSQLTQTLEDLDTYGYAVAPGVFSDEFCASAGEALDDLEARQNEALSGGQVADAPSQTVIYSPNVVDPERFHAFAVGELALGVAERLLEIPFQLSSVAASRSGPEPGKRPHLDGRMPIPNGSTHFSVLYCVDDFRIDNGATMFWPYSHRTGRKPPEGVTPQELPGGMQAEAPRGSAIFFLGSCWHEITPNLSGARRWSVIVTYCRWWVKPSINYAEGLDPDGLELLERDLYGFTSQPPGPRADRHNTVVR